MTPQQRRKLEKAAKRLQGSLAEARGRVLGLEESLSLVESELASDAVDPHVADTGTPSTRDKSYSSVLAPPKDKKA